MNNVQKKSLSLHSYKYLFEHLDRTTQSIKHRFPTEKLVEGLLQNLKYLKELIEDIEKSENKDHFQELAFEINDTITSILDSIALLDWDNVIVPQESQKT